MAKHHVEHNASHDEVHHHHYARGGHTRPPGEDAEEPMSYTAENNVEKEAEGEERKRGGRAKRRERAHGGRVEHGAKHHVEHQVGHEEVHHHHYKRGGHVKKEVDGEGRKSTHRMDRARGGRGHHHRASGGGVGASMNPLSNAAHAREAEAHKADNDLTET